MAWFLQGYVQSHWGQPLFYEQLYFEGNQLVILNPELRENPRLIAEKLLLRFNFNFWTRDLYVEITVERPYGHFQSFLSSHRQNWEKLFSHKGKWIRLHPRLHIKEAFLNWTLKDQSQWHLFLDMQANNQEGGTLHLYFDSKEREKHCLKIQASTSSEGMQAQGECCQVPCASLFALGELLGLEIPLTIHSGLIDGQIHAYFPVRLRPYIEGELRVEELNFSHSSTLQGKIREARIQLEKSPLKNLTHSLSPLVGTIELIKPAFLSYSSPTQTWLFPEITGSIRCKEGEKMWIHLDTEMQQANDRLHLDLQGMAALNSQRFLTLDLHAQEKRGGSVHLILYPTSEGSQRGDIQLHEWTDLEYNCLKSLFTPYFPLLQEIHLEKGILNANIETEVDRGRLQRVNIKQFELSNLVARLPVNPKRACLFNRVGGEGVFLPQQEEIRLHLELEGEATSFMDCFPSPLPKGFSLPFDRQPLLIVATIETEHPQLKIEGDLHVSRKGGEKDCMHFACLWGLKKERGESFPLAGTFYTRKIPLDIYLTPFIFREKTSNLTGEAEVQGTFDEHLLTLHYRPTDLRIENEHFSLEKEGGSFDHSEDLWGEHTFDWRRHSHQGVLPIQHFSYLLKEKGLVFEGIQGVVTFKDQTLSISALEAYSQGIYFAGVLNLDYRDPAPGVFDLYMDCPVLCGTISQVHSFLSHLKCPSFLHSIPLEGEFSAKEKGLHFHFAFVPHDYHLEGDIQGAIFNGMLPFNQGEMALKGLDMDVYYDHCRQTIWLTDIQGSCLIGKPKRVEEYLFLSPCLSISHLSNPDLRIDFSLFKDQKELIRLAGYTKEEQGGKNVYLHLDRSHVSAFHFQKWQCRLRDWMSVEELSIQAEFDVGPLLRDLQGFHSLLGRFDQMVSFSPSIQGRGAFSLDYHPFDHSYDYKIEIPELGGILKGRWQHHQWIIDRLEWKEWALYAEVEQKSDHWRIPFLGLQWGKALLLGLEGTYFSEEGRLKGQMTYCKEGEQPREPWTTLLSKWVSNPFELRFDERELSFQTMLKQDPLDIKVIGEMDWPFFKRGSFSLIERREGGEDSPLKLHWTYERGQGWEIQSIEGGFHGCLFQLMGSKAAKKREMAFNGQVAVNFKQLSPFLPACVQETIEKLKLSSDYLFRGKVKLDFGQGESLWDAFDYEGEVMSQPALLRGFQLQSLEAHVHATLRRIEIEKMSIKDHALECQIPHLIATCEEATKQWSLFIPRLTIRNLRPSL